MANPGAPARPTRKLPASRDDDAEYRAGDVISAAVAAAFMVPVGELRAATRRTASIALARQSAMYLAHVTLGLNLTETGRAFGRDRTTAAHACRCIEDRREEPGLEAALAGLEHALRHASASRAAS